MYHKDTDNTEDDDMDKAIKWSMNRMPQSDDKWLDVMSVEEIEKVRAFHRSFPQYAPTPLANLKTAAAHKKDRK